MYASNCKYTYINMYVYLLLQTNYVLPLSKSFQSHAGIRTYLKLLKSFKYKILLRSLEISDFNYKKDFNLIATSNFSPSPLPTICLSTNSLYLNQEFRVQTNKLA